MTQREMFKRVMFLKIASDNPSNNQLMIKKPQDKHEKLMC